MPSFSLLGRLTRQDSSKKLEEQYFKTTGPEKPVPTVHTKQVVCIFFQVYVEHLPGRLYDHQTSLNKLKNIEIIQSIFSNINRIN